MDKLEKYVVNHSTCGMPRCEYVENDIEIDCDKCQEIMLAEHDAKVRADAIDECMTILKAHHMFRTCEDDYIPKIERPFYQNLWNRFEQLKEQNNG